MKQLLILSGKGGTGKTTIASSFIQLANAKQFADCDVEAPNLHLIYKDGKHHSRPYHGLPKAIIDQEKCIDCGLCKTHCKFNAVFENGRYKIDPYKCEGCGVCEFICPVEAIHLETSIDGSVDTYQNDLLFSTGRLKMGSGNSGLLVSEVKKNLRNHEKLTIIDGPPGIGCPVIASMSGVDFILLIAEPSLSGFSDLKRIIATIKKTKIDYAVCINKYDLNEQISEMMIDYLEDNQISYVGYISYSKDVNDYNNQGKSIVELDGPVAKQIRDIYREVKVLI